jgi:hypothetical protein
MKKMIMLGPIYGLKCTMKLYDDDYTSDIIIFEKIYEKKIDYKELSELNNLYNNYKNDPYYYYYYYYYSKRKTDTTFSWVHINQNTLESFFKKYQ